VGTKLELAREHGHHHGVGIDLVAMCVNDVITTGAQPLFFLDYIATGKLEPERLAEVVEGIAAGCRLSGCALLGGETAEMPGFYAAGRYDLAGFCVGVVEEDLLVDGRAVRAGDRIVAVASSGVHSNGFSLVRRVLELACTTPDCRLTPEGPAVIEALLEPTQLYADLVRRLRESGTGLHGMAHITGGGLPENLPRCLPEGLRAAIDPQSWERPPLFRWLQEKGAIPEADLWNTFNLGVGFCLVVPAAEAEAVIELCCGVGHQAWELGAVEEAVAAGPRLIGVPN
jgi:phosphoribosylformylglycinamidine cyclo-ligase